MAFKLSREAKNRCNKRLKSEFTPSLDILRGEMSHYEDAYQDQLGADEATWHLPLDCIPAFDKDIWTFLDRKTFDVHADEKFTDMAGHLDMTKTNGRLPR